MKIREMTHEDIPTVVELLLGMLNDMAVLSEQVMALDNQAAAWLAGRARASLQDDQHTFLLADPAETVQPPVGVVEASIVQPHPVFAARQTLHIHSVYVLPRWRRQGIARQMMVEMLNWGRRQNCVDAELNVLAGNSALRMYERLGFSVFQLEMRIPL